jgi:hypothetical protein
MASLHVALAWSVVASIVALAAIAGLVAVGRLRGRRWLDRALLVQLGLSLLAVLTGALTVPSGPPREPLHFLYAVVVTVGPATGRWIGHGRADRSVGRWVAGGALVSLGAVVRSFMTG